MAPQTTTSRTWRRLSRSYIVIGLVLILGLEAISSGLIYARYDWARDPNNPDFLERYSFTRTFLRPFMQHRYDYLRTICDNPTDFRNPFPWVAIRLFPPDPLYGHRMGSDVCFRRKGSVVVTNAQGFSMIGTEDLTYAREKPESTYRVVMMGGSTVMGLGAETPDLNLPAFVDRDYSAIFRANEPGLELEVINGGVGGYFSANEFLYLASELVHYDPDLVIIYDGWNDFQYRNRYDGTFLGNPRTEPNRRVLDMGYNFGGSLASFLGNGYLIGKSVFDRSASLFLVRLALARLRSPAATVPTRESLAEATTTREVALRRYERNLRLIISTAEIHRFDIALFLQPLLLDDGGHEERKKYYLSARTMFADLRREFEMEDSVCIADLSKSLDQTDPKVAYYDSGHLLGAGNEIVGRALVRELVACNLP